MSATSALAPKKRRPAVANRQGKPRERRREKRQRVQNTLRTMILTGQCALGSRLMQNDLAAQLETSVNSVREALFELRYSGLVEKLDGVGFFVRKLTCDDFVEASDLYQLHQGFAARLCCRHASRRDLDGLRELAQQILANALSERAEDLQEIALLDREFHDRIMRIAGSRALARVRETYWVPILDVDVTSEKCKRRFRGSYDEHLAIVDAIGGNQPDDAERLMRQHYENNYCSFEQEEAKRGDPTVGWHCRSVAIGNTVMMAVSFDSGAESDLVSNSDRRIG